MEPSQPTNPTETQLRAIYSAYANRAAIPPELSAGLPAIIHLMQHQVQTYCAVRDRVADVIIHTGKTGDGKSLAGFLAALAHPDHHILAMYPTNELIADQERHLKDHLKAWNIQRRILPLNAQALDAKMERYTVDRPTALVSILDYADIILTNPDVFHYIMAGLYHRQGFQPLNIIQGLMLHYRQITIDEFHLFDQAQTTALLTAMVFIKYACKDNPPVFVLQSATPDASFREALERGGLTIHEIKGEYSDADQIDPNQYRTIQRAAKITLTTQPITDWLKKDGAPMLGSALAEGHGRGAVLFTGVFNALEALPTAKSLLPTLSVLPNTGLTPPSIRKESRHADLLIGTATVDTGVDLEINRLVFEAHDADNFKQRLGRLGRHDGYADRAGQKHAFTDFAAVASVPAWIAASIGENLQSEMTRDSFFELVSAAYGSKRGHIYAYNQLWGWLLAYDLYNRLRNPTIQEQYADIRPIILEQLAAALDVRLDNKWSTFKEMNSLPAKKRLIREAFAFRGSSAFTALIVNDAYNGVEKYQFYDLLSTLPRVEFEVLDYHMTYQQAEHAGVPKKTLERENPVVALRWRGMSTERRKLIVEIDGSVWNDLESEVSKGQVLLVSGLMARTDPAVALGTPALQKIQDQSIAVRICMNFTPSTLQQRLRLGAFFPLYHFQTYRGDTGTIVLGREALLLDAAIFYLREENPGAIIC